MRRRRACCINDEGEPLGFVNQMEKPNPLMRLFLREMVVSDKGKSGNELSGMSHRDEYK